MVHVRGEEGEASSCRRPDESITSKSAVSVHKIHVDDILLDVSHDVLRTVSEGFFTFKPCMKIMRMPAPIGIPARTCGTQLICGLLVHCIFSISDVPPSPDSRVLWTYRKPEETAREECSSDNHWRKAFLRDDFALLLQLACKTRLGHVRDD